VRSPGARIVCDRFVGSDWAFFISNVWLGNIAEEAVGRYSALYTHLMADVPMVRDVFFLDAPPAICLERVRMRSRGAESGISAAYLEMLGRGYESARARLEAQGVRWHVLDWAGAGDHAALEAAVAATEPFSDAELARMPSLAEQRRRVARLDAWFAEEIARVGAHELAGACR
jgi:thymidylate kinase